MRRRHRPLHGSLAEVPGSAIESCRGQEDEDDGEDEGGVAMHPPHTTVVLAAPPSLSAVHHVEDVEADAIELGELRLENLLSVEVVEGKVVDATSRACPALLLSVQSRGFSHHFLAQFSE